MAPSSARPSRARALMVQGTGSDVGKSTLVAGLCRAAKRRGLRVRPFKPQNMSNNAAVAADGGEIGRAQALQARACGVAPSVHMNPVLLKPESNVGSQVVVQGRVLCSTKAAEYQRLKATLREPVMESFARLEAEADLVLVEGAGSAAEVNLRKGDLANMGFAVGASVPVILVGDIDRGGVIASLVGTHALLAPEERALVRGFVINKFRGDVRLFDEGLEAITARTAWRSFGVVPWLSEVARLPAEDSVRVAASHEAASEEVVFRVAVPVLSRLANFDDFDPLALEPGVRVTFVPPGEPLPANADLVVLPGTKSTIADLFFFRAQGWDIDLFGHVRRGGRVLGLCGGYQMLGRKIRDPNGVEGPDREASGLGLLDVETVLAPEKTLREARGRHAETGAPLRGYEIHSGVTDGPGCTRPFSQITRTPPAAETWVPEGAVDASGRVAGTYLHGLFTSDEFRAAYLRTCGVGAGAFSYDEVVERALDALADHLEEHLDVTAILSSADAVRL